MRERGVVEIPCTYVYVYHTHEIPCQVEIRVLCRLKAGGSSLTLEFVNEEEFIRNQSQYPLSYTLHVPTQMLSVLKTNVI